jgi:type IV pilus assembly protein PilM
MLVQELNRSLQLFFSSSAYTQLEYLYLAGDACHLIQLTSLLSQRIDIPVLLANPFLGMKFSSRVNQSIVESQASLSLVAVGLALSGMEV